MIIMMKIMKMLKLFNLNHLVNLLSNLFEYSLQVSYPPLQEASLTCISLLSNLLEKDFEFLNE